MRRRGAIRSFRLIAIDPSCRRETACAPSSPTDARICCRDCSQLGVLREDAVVDEPSLGHERHRPFSVAADEERAVVHDERAERVHQDPGKEEEREEHVRTPNDGRDRHRLPQSQLAPRRNIELYRHERRQNDAGQQHAVPGQRGEQHGAGGDRPDTPSSLDTRAGRGGTTGRGSRPPRVSRRPRRRRPRRSSRDASRSRR